MTSTEPIVTERPLAALDLGSNSFHLLVATLSNGRLQVIDKLKDMVRLGAGLDTGNRIQPDAEERALACLARYAQRLRGFPPDSVRVVGTNTLRRAENGEAFIAKAESVLGHRIEVIAGREEARLIYLGVCYSLQDDHRRRFVVDIGGGSTELIVGEPYLPDLMESLDMGSTSFTQRYFGDGKLRESSMRAAILAARLELDPVKRRFRSSGWDTAIGASGTVLAIRDIAHQNGWCREGITRGALEQMQRAVCSAKHISQLSLRGLSAERAPVLPGGLAILRGICESLDIDRMEVADGALREGLLQDLLDRFEHDDIREHSVDDVARRYHVDEAQSARVRNTALDLLIQLESLWKLDRDAYRARLVWAGRLHEIGLDISHNQYHRHGDYLLQNLDLAGFSRSEQNRLALLVRAHRRKFPLAEFRRLPDAERLPHIKLAVLLRLAVLLHRSRDGAVLPRTLIKAEGDAVQLTLPAAWLDDHPLTRLDLEQEAAYLRAIPVKLAINAI